MNTPKEMQIIAPEGWEIDREKSTLDKIVFKEIKSKYPMELVPDSMVLSIADKLNLFGRLVLTCREWNKIDGFENKCGLEKYSIGFRNGKVVVFESAYELISKPISLKDIPTAQQFLSTFKTELKQVKDFL